MNSSQTTVTDFPLCGIQLLEASAGTGKTWNIASLYVRLILGHGRNEQGLMPNEILVVTFTKAATQELQDRIRKRLNHTALFLRALEGEGTDPIRDSILEEAREDALLEGLRAYYEENPEKRSPHAYRLGLAADSMDDAAIFTIHGWCQRMLKQHAFDSGSLFDLKVETDEAEILRECVRDYWRTVIYPLDKTDLQRIHDFSKIKDPESLFGQIKDLVRLPPDALKSLKNQYAGTLEGLTAALHASHDWETALAQARSEVKTIWATAFEDILAVIQSALDERLIDRTRYAKEAPPRLNKIHEWANSQETHPEGLKLEHFATGRFKLAKGASEEPKHRAFEAIATYLALSENEEKPKAIAAAVKHALISYAAYWVKERFEQIKNDRAVIDQNDLVLKLHEAITQDGGTRLAEIIRVQYPVALIDEFQDTDPLQYGIFKAVYAKGNPHNAWLMVGDPKQAIYSFRGADIYSYLDARSQPGVERHTLGMNFRSTKEMVTAVNQVFAYAEDRWDQGAFNFPKSKNGERPIPFEEVEPKDRSERLYQRVEGLSNVITGLQFWYLQNDATALGAEAFKTKMANIAANTIVDLLNQSLNRDVPKENQVFFAEKEGNQARCLVPGDIAILVSDWTEAKAIQDALRLRNLQSVYLSDRDSILNSDEAKDLAIWLEAFISPRDARRIRSAMATRTLNLTYTTLDRLNTDEVFLDGVIERFVGYSALWREQGILPALHQFILDQALPAERIGQSGGERTLTNLLHLSELLQREAAHLDGQNGLLRFLRESIEEAGNDEENILRLESDSALIRVITIHKSKGLEFPLVFLPFVALSKPLDAKKDYYKFHDESLKLKVSLHATSNADPSPLDLADGERLQESLRLLYVALTRACHACWVGIGPFKKGASSTNGKKKDESTSLHQGALGYLLKGGAPVSIPELGGLLKAISGEGKNVTVLDVQEESRIDFKGRNESPGEREHRLRFQGPKVFEPWRIDSYSRLLGYMANGDEAWGGSNENKTEAGSGEGASSNLDGLHGFPAGPSHGDFLHKLLEKVGEAGFDHVTQDSNLRLQIVEESMKLQNYGEEWPARLNRWLEQFLTCGFTLGDKRMQLSRLEARDCRMELEFWFEIKQANLKAIDRVVTEHILKGQPRPPLKEEHLNGMLKGFIDLTFRFKNQFYVADYKSNQLGKTDDVFTKEAQNREVLKHRYDLQYSLYTLALHRYLRSRIGEDYDYDQSVGGVAYFFLRGIHGPTNGVHFVKPPREMIEALDAIFSGQVHEVNHAA